MLYFAVIHTPNPPFEDNDGGMAVNFGTSDVGSGDIQPTTLVPVTTQPIEQINAANNAAASQENLETQDLEDAPTLPSAKEPVKKNPVTNPDAQFKPTKNNTTATPPTPTPPKPDQNALFTKGAKGPNNNSAGDGEGGGKGDQGKPNGDPNATSYKGNGTGGGSGNGSGLGNGSVKLTGRSTRYKPTPSNPCAEARGKVNITIKVNQEGKVVSTAFTQSGSTTTDDCLVDVAKKAAAQYLFDVKEDAPPVQTGSIFFIFGER